MLTKGRWFVVAAAVAVAGIATPPGGPRLALADDDSSRCADGILSKCATYTACTAWEYDGTKWVCTNSSTWNQYYTLFAE